MPVDVEPAVADPTLDNPCWASLTTGHAHLAEVHGRVRRYPPEVARFAAVETFDADAWTDLATLIGPGARCLIMRDKVPEPPAGWVEDVRGPGIQMVTGPDGLGPVGSFTARRLTVDDVPQMVDLVRLTQPGPFEPRTIEMGRYLGHFDGDRLLAMAGERLRPGSFTEISAVCTHPDARGRGLASALTALVAEGIVERGGEAVLHVASFNTGAFRTYERLGFVVRRTIEFAAVRAPG